MMKFFLNESSLNIYICIRVIVIMIRKSIKSTKPTLRSLIN